MAVQRRCHLKNLRYGNLSVDIILSNVGHAVYSAVNGSMFVNSCAAPEKDEGSPPLCIFDEDDGDEKMKD